MRIFNSTRCDRLDANWAAMIPKRGSDQLIQRIDIDFRSKIVAKKIDWDEYWKASIEYGREIGVKLNTLREARDAYLLAPTNNEHLKEYCRAYFELLYSAVHSENGRDSPRLLRSLVGFETIPIHWDGSTFPDLIAVNTKTNPIYLLSRILQPNSWDNPRFFPMVSCDCEHFSSEQRFPAYYQYRRISGGSIGSTTLFTYIPVAIEDRKNSFIA